MYPEVEKYLQFAEKAEADDTTWAREQYAAVSEATRRMPYGEARGRVWDEHWKLRSEHTEAMEASIAQAVQELRDTLTDPLAQWLLGEPWKEEEDHALEVLKLLPAPVSRIRQLADEEDWCPRFWSYLVKARDADVLPKPAPTEAREELHGWFAANCAWDDEDSQHGELDTLLDALVAAGYDTLRAEVKELRKSDALLNAMYAAGVDNWPGMEFVERPDEDE